MSKQNHVTIAVPRDWYKLNITKYLSASLNVINPRQLKCRHPFQNFSSVLHIKQNISHFEKLTAPYQQFKNAPENMFECKQHPSLPVGKEGK